MRALVLLSVLASLLAGCAAPAAAPSTDPSEPRVNRLVFVVTTPGRTDLDLRFLAEPNVWHMRPVYDFLINVDAKTGKLVPGLASEWKLEPNGESFRLKLRDAQFHGKWGSVRAEDVRFGWEQLILPDSLHGQMPYFRDNVRSIEVINDKELIFHMKGRDGILITALSEYQGGLEVRSKANFDASGPPTYQTGPLAASYWRAVGVNVQLQTMEVPEINRIGRAFGFNNHLAIAATGSNQWSGQSIWGSTITHLGNGFESAKVDAILRQVATEVDSQKQEAFWRQVGDAAFDEFQYVNLFWLPTEAVGNPKIVGEWTYPGGITGSWTHIVNIKGAR